jgi:hypothetical protein
MAPQPGLSMERRRLTNLILLAVAGFLGLLIWQAQPPGFTPLTPLDANRIERIDISDLSGRHIHLQKTAGSWLIDGAPANQERIRQLLGICATPSLESFAAPQDLTPFGLDPATIRLQLNGLTLDFGNTDPVNGWRYVHFEQQVLLIADGYYHHLTAPPAAWLASP